MPSSIKPPPYNAVKASTRKYRFIASDDTYKDGISPAIITSAKLCALEVITTVVNTTGTQLFESVRVKSIKIWAWARMSGGTITPVSCSVTAEGAALGALGNHKTLSDSTQSTEIPAYVNFVFDDTFQAGQWQTGDTSLGSNSLFTLVVPVGAVIDIVLDVKATRNIRTTANTVTLSGLAALTDYFYLSLDNTAGGTGSVGGLLKPDPSLHTNP